MEQGTAYIEYTTMTLISVTNTSHAEVDEQDATAGEVRQKLLYITHTFELHNLLCATTVTHYDVQAIGKQQQHDTCSHDSVATCCSQLRRLQFATNCTKNDHEVEALLALLASQAAPEQPA